VKVLEKAKPEIIYVFVPNVNENYFLKDYRLLQSYGEINFGTIGQVAKNLGVSYKKKEDGLIGGLNWKKKLTCCQLFLAYCLLSQ
jgi:hypothetical protein